MKTGNNRRQSSGGGRCFGHLVAVLVSLSHVTFSDTGVNLAQTGTATQSGNLSWPDVGDYWYASLALDGQRPTTNPESPSDGCSGALPPSTGWAWWQVDLGGVFSIGRVDVYGPPASPPVQFRGFRMYFNESNSRADLMYTNNITEDAYNQNHGHFLVLVFPPKRTRYVYLDIPMTYTIQKPALVLCEIKIYEACGRREYGPSCTSVCSCPQNGPCDPTTGHCLPNVAINKTVTMSSTLFYYNKNWTGSHAVDGTHRPDWTLPDQCKCCSSTHLETRPWLQVNLLQKYYVAEIYIAGRSDNYADDYTRNLEDMRVYFRQHTVGMTDGEVLSQVEGETTQYILNMTSRPPFQYITLVLHGSPTHSSRFLIVCEIQVFIKECPDYQFGAISCGDRCHCRDGPCNEMTGLCPSPRCQPGWSGLRCDIECLYGTFGSDCNRKCHCSHLGDTCNKTSGSCPGDCDSGYHGITCEQECEDGHFGFGCTRTCHCGQHGDSCIKMTGVCPGDCQLGYHGNTCEDECTNVTYGVNCNQTCGNCMGRNQCDIYTGHCQDGCENQYTGVRCMKYEPLTSDSGDPIAVIGGAVGGVVILAAAVIATLLILRRRRQNSTRKASQSVTYDNIVERNVVESKTGDSNPSKTGEKRKRGQMGETLYGASCDFSDTDYTSFPCQGSGIVLCELWDYIQRGKYNGFEALHTEFKKLKGGLAYACTAAHLVENRRLNRHKDIYAYDHSRVSLEVNVPGETDYINACYIDGYDHLKKFIASQGPTVYMVDDFWRMVWQRHAGKIVMLTNPSEMGQQKCLQYWPDKDEISFGLITIKFIKSVEQADYIIRTLELKMNEEERRVTQFHFKAWQENDVLDNAWALANFWRVECAMCDHATAPIIVHCSAGVGPTGIFIALDNMYAQAKAEGVVRPLSLVDSLRRQRINMVQTKEQYVYLHEVVAEVLCFGTQAVPVKRFEEVCLFMTSEVDDVTGRPMLAVQYALLQESLSARTSSNVAGPQYSNIATDASEIDVHRPKMKTKSAAMGKGINAFYLPNHLGNNNFIAAISPSKTTLEEFWTLVDENNVTSVIMLTTQSDKKYETSRQLGVNNRTDTGPYIVNHHSQREAKNFTERCFTFRKQDADAGDLATVKQFQLLSWGDHDVVPRDTRSVLDLLDALVGWQSHVSESQPILVHCSTGAERAGLLCVLLCELQRMKCKRQINILETVKTMKTRNSQLIPNYEQYLFCHDVIFNNVRGDSNVYQNV